MSSGAASTNPLQYYALHVSNNNNNNNPPGTASLAVDATYTDPAQTKLVELRLRRAYVVAGILCAVSVILALVPVVYVGSAAGWNDGRPPVSNWTVCWPCESLRASPSSRTVSDGSRRLCCAEMDSKKSMCKTIYEKSNHMVSCWQNYSEHLELDDRKTDSCLPAQSANKAEVLTSKQVDGWKNSSAAASGATLTKSNLTINVFGVYVIYSKIAFKCLSTAEDSTSQAYVHTINVVSAQSQKPEHLVRSKRRMDESPMSSSSSDICYNSFLTTTVELHKGETIHVSVQPCHLVWRRDSLSTFGMFRIG